MMHLIKYFHKQQSGQILIMVTILVCLSSIMVIPLMGWMSSGLKITQNYQRNTKEIYAADAGFQYATWKIKFDPAVVADRTRSGYGAVYSYPAALTVNNNVVDVSFDSIWLLSGVVRITTGATPHETWMEMQVSGNLDPTVYNDPVVGNYSIYTMTFTMSSSSKKLDQLGLWMPHGFTYIPGSCNPTRFPNNIAQHDPNSTSAVYGGTNLVWNVPSNFNLNGTATQQFWYTPAGTVPEGAAAWVKALSQDIGYQWDNAVWWYRVTSTATDNSTVPPTVTTTKALVLSDSRTASGVKTVTYFINR